MSRSNVPGDTSGQWAGEEATDDGAKGERVNLAGSRSETHAGQGTCWSPLTARGCALVLRIVTAVVAVALAVTSLGASAQEGTLRPGEVVITQFREGLVLAIDSQGVTRTLISGLVTPRGVAVLLDQTVLVAENSANQITVFGGVFGTSKLKLADFPAPESLAVAPDGQTAYVTSFANGILGVVDLANRKVETVATGFVQPTGVYVRGSDIYVAEVGAGENTGRILKVTKDGQKSVFAEGLGGPFGLAGTPDGLLYVTDYKNDRILKVDADGNVSEFVKATKPVGIGVSPVQPRPNEPYVIIANTENSVRYWDAAGNEVGAPVFYSASSAVGLSVVPGGTATVPTAGAGGTSTTRGSGPVVTRPAGSTTLLQNPLGRDDESSIVGPLLVASVFIVLVGAGVTAAVLVARRNRTSAEAGFADLESQFTMTQAMGPCAALEVEVAGAESALASVLEQIDAAKARQLEAGRRVEAAKRREELARTGGLPGASTQSAPAETSEGAASASGGLTLEQLNLRTEEGRAALRAFGRKEITAAELRERWEALGETDAIRVVTRAGSETSKETEREEAGDGNESDEVGAVEGESPLERARSERERAERELKEATTDLGRLAEREKLARVRLEEARRKLAECHEQQRIAEEEAAEAAAAAFAQHAASEDEKWDRFVAGVPSESEAAAREETDRGGASIERPQPQPSPDDEKTDPSSAGSGEVAAAGSDGGVSDASSGSSSAGSGEVAAAGSDGG
ncbi:MAG: hypothetical protein N2037_10055, partial [Acidimicrobiales bacterium]|nr:hypothetical protein [Acidimicrobiales bacterium]